MLRNVLFAAAVAAAVARPAFPKDYYAEEFALNIGPDGSIEQTAHTRSCWQRDAAGNKTAFQALDGGEGQMFDFDQNVVYVLENNVCQFYCDASDEEQCDLEDSLCSYDYLTSAVWNGTTVVNGTQVDSWTWTEGLGPIVFNTLTLYVASPNTSRPVQMYRQLTPFGNYEGAFVNNFWTFTPGTPPASCFAVPSEQYCPAGDPDAQCSDYVGKLQRMKRALAAAQAQQ